MIMSKAVAPVSSLTGAKDLVVDDAVFKYNHTTARTASYKKDLTDSEYI